MNPADITPKLVHEALRAIRHGGALEESPLIHLEAVRARLAAESRTDSREGRAQELAAYLDDIVSERLQEARGAALPPDRTDPSPENELRMADADYRHGGADLQAWSILHLRFFSVARVSMSAAADRLGVSARTLARRADMGYELLAAELRSRESIPSPQPRHNIPHPITRFINREREFAIVRSLLAQYRMVTVTGTAGVGKSRLAMELGRELAPDFSDGSWLVSLGVVDDSRRVATAIAAGLGIREMPGVDLDDALDDHLADKHLLLIFDDCEHLTDTCCHLVDRLLGKCPDLHVLATSQSRIGLAGECAWTLGPLDLPPEMPDEGVRPSSLAHYDSVRLFADRALAARPGFEMSGDTARQVAYVCRALDGIPLAVELAASQLRVLSPAELVSRLDDHVLTLRDGHRPARPQHETMLDAISWSISPLEELELSCFRWLSVFHGGWTLEAAEAVFLPGGLGRVRTLDVLSSLASRSLIEVRHKPDGTRYSMLSALCRFARQQLHDSGDEPDVKDRHLEYYANLAETAEPQLKGDGQAAWLEVLHSEHENFASALAWAEASGSAEMSLRLSGALARYCELRGHFSEGRAWLAGSLTLPGAESATSARAKALSGAGALAEEQGDYVSATDHHRDSLQIRRDLGDTTGVAESLNNLGNVANNRGDYAAARQLHEEALELRREIGDPWGIAVSLNNLGNVAEYQADFEAARDMYEESAVMLRRLGDQWALAVTLNNLGLVASDLGDYDDAQTYLDDSLEIARELGDRQGEAYALHTLGDVARRRGDVSEARSQHAASLEIARDLGDLQGVAESLESFAFLAFDDRRLATAVELLGTADALRERIGAPLTDSEGPALNRALDALRSSLTDGAFDSAWTLGRLTDVEDQVAHVLNDARSHSHRAASRSHSVDRS